MFNKRQSIRDIDSNFGTFKRHQLDSTFELRDSRNDTKSNYDVAYTRLKKLFNVDLIMSDCEVGPKKALVETFEQPLFFGTYFMDLQV